MSRIIQQPCTEVTLVPDPSFGTRPQRIRWRDRWGELHQLHVARVAEDWHTTGEWWDRPKGLAERRYWRVDLKPAGRALLYEDLDKAPGEAGRWWIDRIED